MKQKLLSIFALAAMLLLPQSLWADALSQDYQYSLTTTGTSFGTEGSTDSDGATQYTKDGITFYIKGVTAETESPYRWKFDKSTTAYIKVVLEQPIQSGDIIAVYAQSSYNERSINILTQQTKQVLLMQDYRFL